MKKLLSLLSVLTISGTAIPTTIAASSYEKQLQINAVLGDGEVNYQEINNLNRWKRHGTAYLSGFFTVTNLGKLKNVYAPRDKKIIDKLLEFNSNVPNELKTNGVLVVKSKGDNWATIGVREPGLGGYGDRIYYDYYGTVSVTFY